LHPVPVTFDPLHFTAIALDLQTRIAALKAETEVDFAWYPYDSLGNVERMLAILQSIEGTNLSIQPGDRVLDIGCGDGEMSFLLESAGYRVTAIDYSLTNHNRMEGVRTLKRLLGSKIEIIDIDLDNDLAPLDGQHAMALCFGLLYHLKNPFYLLEQISRHAQFCFLSTRVASHFPDGIPMAADQPIAYLVDENELNADRTNYWIFSRPGLNRLFKRTRWEVVASINVGETRSSDPVNPDKDERVFCLLQSHYGLANLQLGEGWHELEGTGWRWTKRVFVFSASVDTGNTPERVKLRFFVPPETIRQVGPSKLSGTVNGVALPPFVIDTPGDHRYVAELRGLSTPLVFRFELDRCKEPSADDDRELGIIVASVDFQ
jgi:tRNA (mo5U34)-methyltransferase